MSGPPGNEHFIEAERLLTVGAGQRGSDMDRACTLAAQVHATLALVWAANRAQTEAYGLLRLIIDDARERAEAREAAGPCDDDLYQEILTRLQVGALTGEPVQEIAAALVTIVRNTVAEAVASA